MNINISNLYFFKDLNPLDKTQSLVKQCSDGDTISICNLHLYKIKWKGYTQDIRYYTNMKFETLSYYIFQILSIPPINYSNYKLCIKAQPISLSDLIPFEGINDEIEVVDAQSI